MGNRAPPRTPVPSARPPSPHPAPAPSARRGRRPTSRCPCAPAASPATAAPSTPGTAPNTGCTSTPPGGLAGLPPELLQRQALARAQLLVHRRKVQRRPARVAAPSGRLSVLPPAQPLRALQQLVHRPAESPYVWATSHYWQPHSCRIRSASSITFIAILHVGIANPLLAIARSLGTLPPRARPRSSRPGRCSRSIGTTFTFAGIRTHGRWHPSDPSRPYEICGADSGPAVGATGTSTQRWCTIRTAKLVL